MQAITLLGFKSRGLKYRPDLYVLRNTMTPAMLVECCFVDDKDDVHLYDYRNMAGAIVYGITGQRVQEAPEKQKQEKKLPWEIIMPCTVCRLAHTA